MVCVYVYMCVSVVFSCLSQILCQAHELEFASSFIALISGSYFERITLEMFVLIFLVLQAFKGHFSVRLNV